MFFFLLVFVFVFVCLFVCFHFLFHAIGRDTYWAINKKQNEVIEINSLQPVKIIMIKKLLSLKNTEILLWFLLRSFKAFFIVAEVRLIKLIRIEKTTNSFCWYQMLHSKCVRSNVWVNEKVNYGISNQLSPGESQNKMKYIIASFVFLTTASSDPCKLIWWMCNLKGSQLDVFSP